jgi:hypothetical protein
MAMLPEDRDEFEPEMEFPAPYQPTESDLADYSAWLDCFPAGDEPFENDGQADEDFEWPTAAEIDHFERTEVSAGWYRDLLLQAGFDGGNLL